MAATYTIVTGEGGELAAGISEETVRTVAQRCANEIGATVYYSLSGGADLDPADDEDIGTPVDPEDQRLLATDAGEAHLRAWIESVAREGVRHDEVLLEALDSIEARLLCGEDGMYELGAQYTVSGRPETYAARADDWRLVRA